MNRKILDLLVCPVDKHYPLILHELKSINDNVIDGVLTCEKCGNYYLVTNEIPILLSSELRDRKATLDFLKTWSGKLPEAMSKSFIGNNG